MKPYVLNPPPDLIVVKPMSADDIAQLKALGFSDGMIAGMKAAQDSMAGLVVIPKVQR